VDEGDKNEVGEPTINSGDSAEGMKIKRDCE
jgi:hypothetical protein